MLCDMHVEKRDDKKGLDSTNTSSVDIADFPTAEHDCRVYDGTWVPEREVYALQTRRVCSLAIDSRTELDSHADSPCVGHNALILEDTGRRVNVNVALPTMGSRQASIVNAAVSYDAPDGNVYVIVINQALHFNELQHNLVGPNMI